MEISIVLKMVYFLMINKFKENLKSNNFEFQEITDQLLWIKNFLNKEELIFIWKVINNASQENWEVEYMGNLKNFCLEKLLINICLYFEIHSYHFLVCAFLLLFILLLLLLIKFL